MPEPRVKHVHAESIWVESMPIDASPPSSAQSSFIGVSAGSSTSREAKSVAAQQLQRSIGNPAYQNSPYCFTLTPAYGRGAALSQRAETIPTRDGAFESVSADNRRSRLSLSWAISHLPHPTPTSVSVTGRGGVG